MMPWVTLWFEAGLATLMVVLIVYCIKLNKRLSLLRNQNAEFADMMIGLKESSERAEQSVQHLKAAGLSAERSLRSVIDDATAVQAALMRQVSKSSKAFASERIVPQSGKAAPENGASARPDTPKEPRQEKVKRDMLIGEKAAPSENMVAVSPSPERPKTRQEAEETVLQAIRSARVGT
jgi:hypothetical protein